MNYKNKNIEIKAGDAVIVSDYILPEFRTIVVATRMVTDEMIEKVMASQPANVAASTNAFYLDPNNRIQVIVHFPDEVYDADFEFKMPTMDGGKMPSTIDGNHYFITNASCIRLVAMEDLAEESDRLKTQNDGLLSVLGSLD